MAALDVHVPFCAQKCRYCDFDSRSFVPCDLDAALDVYFEQLYVRLDAFGDAGALAQIGDLAASLIKRDCGVKDFGKIFPGHGGVMDRLDGILFATLACHLFFRMMG